MDLSGRPAESTAARAAAAGGFPALLVVRGLTLVNDHALKWMAIGLGKRLVDEGSVSLVLTVGLVGLSLPYVLLSWLAGSLADRHAKTAVIRWAKAGELLVVGIALAVVAFGLTAGDGIAGLPMGVWLLLAAVVAIGTQAALMTPALVGALPEIVPPAALAGANGTFSLVSLLAVLAGTAAGNWVADATPLAAETAGWTRCLPAAAILGGTAVAGWLAAVLLPRLPPAAPDAPPAWNALARTGSDLRLLAGDPALSAAAAGIVFFWAIAAVAQANVDQFATEAGATSQGRIIPLLVALVGGIGAGSVITGRLAGRPASASPRVDLGYVPVGAVVMAVAFVALAAMGGRFLADGGIAWAPLVWLVVLGFGAGMFDVPLETYLQERAPSGRLGGVLAATNLLLFSGMFLASLAYGGLRAPLGPGGTPLLSARSIFGLFAATCLVAAAAAVWCAPRASLRLLVAGIVRSIWRLRVRGLENIPATGPVVVVGNHVSWLDGFLLPLVSPRPIRMVVYGPNIRGRLPRMLADQWRFILFDPRPKSIGAALDAIRAGLAAGDAIGIFCEGGISRTGQVIGFKRGLEWLLERVASPIVPVSIDGMWGSVLSFSEGRFFGKWPRSWRRTVTLTFGSALPAGTSPDDARLALQETGAWAAARRLRPPAAAAEAFDGACLLRRDDRLVTTLAAADPLADLLGAPAGRLLGIRSVSLPPDTPAAAVLARLVGERATIWAARPDQVLAAADVPPPAGEIGGELSAVVMPIDGVDGLAVAARARDRFRERFGLEPVVAFAPREAGGLVAMRSPTRRMPPGCDTMPPPESLGRVVSGVVVWPTAAVRERLGIEPAPRTDPGPPAAGGGAAAAADRAAAVVVGATLPSPGPLLLAARLEVDENGFLVPAGPARESRTRT